MSSSYILSDNGLSSGSAGLKSSAGNDGVLVLQTANSSGTATNAVYVDNNQQVGLGTSSPDNILHLYAAAPRLTFTATNNSSGARYNTLGTATTGSHRFQYGGTDVLIAGITGYTTALQGASSVAGTGISFPATQSASSDANTLDDYEEGTWTPATSTTGYTISAASGKYTKVGNLVTVHFYVDFSAVNASSNSDVLLSGLPFAPVPLASAIGQPGVAREDTSTGAIFVLRVSGTASTVEINSMNGVAANSVLTLQTGKKYIGTVTYFA